MIFEQGNLYEKRSTASAAGRRLTVLERLELASDGDWHASEQVAALPASAATNAQPPGGSTALLRSAVKSTSASGYVDRGYLMSQGQWIGP